MSENEDKRILIVDDSREAVDVLSRVLQKYGTVDTAENGSEALVKMTLNDFDVIVSDVDMAVMDGIELYNEALKINPHVCNIFLFYTGSFQEDHEIFFMKNNVSFLHRPSRIEDIESSVQKILSRNF